MSELKPCQMTPEEAIKILERSNQLLKEQIRFLNRSETMLSADDHSLYQSTEYCHKEYAACELAIAALLAQPANDPLTLEQLREMDGEPVWCEDTTNYSGIIKLAEDWSTDKPEAHVWTFDEEGNPKCYNVRLMMELGEKLYRRKPEGSENDAIR